METLEREKEMKISFKYVHNGYLTQLYKLDNLRYQGLSTVGQFDSDRLDFSIVKKVMYNPLV